MRDIFSTIILIHLNFYYCNIEAKLTCNSTDAYEPCDCFPITSQIQCKGNNVTEQTLINIGAKLSNDSNKEINILLISNTSIETIGKIFTEIKFKKIFIELNKNLINISPDAFKKGNLKSLVIRDNSKLNDMNIFKLAKNLEPSETIEFDNNSLTEIPKNAFQLTGGSLSISLKHIYLDHNKINKIGGNAFNNLSKLEVVSLNNNSIAQIDENGLKFGDKINSTILLDNNQLTLEALQTINLSITGITQLNLHLENNKINDLPETIFRELLESGKIELFLNGNDFKCRNCTLQWLLNPKVKALDNLHSVFCKDEKGIKVPVSQLDKEEVCKN